MGKQRRTFSNAFKARIALETLKGEKTISEIDSAHQLHPTQVTAWKKQLKTAAPDIFSKGTAADPTSEEELTAPLYEEIGRLKVDIKWLQKKL